MKTKKFALLMLIIINIVLLTSLMAYNLLLPKLNLETYSKTINIGSNYKSINYSATFMNKDVTDNVITTGTIDTSKVGTYPITYILNIGDFKVEKTYLFMLKILSHL